VYPTSENENSLVWETGLELLTRRKATSEPLHLFLRHITELVDAHGPGNFLSLILLVVLRHLLLADSEDLSLLRLVLWTLVGLGELGLVFLPLLVGGGGSVQHQVSRHA